MCLSHLQVQYYPVPRSQGFDILLYKFPEDFVDINYSYRFLNNNEVDTCRFARTKGECLKC